MTTQEFTKELKAVVEAGVARGIALQGKEFTFERPEGRTAEEGFTLPELIFQALGAAYVEGMAQLSRSADSGEDPEPDYSNLIEIGHNLLAHVADQVRGV